MDIRAEFEATGREWPAIGDFLSKFRDVLGAIKGLTKEEREGLLYQGYEIRFHKALRGEQ